MGAVNYGRNKDFVTLGYDFRLLENDDDHMNCQDEYEQVKWILDDLKSDCLYVKVEAGYYEGFWIKIGLDVVWFANYEEKKQTLKDVRELERKLLAIVDDFKVLAVDCWWVSTWYTKEDTRKKIRQSASELRKRIKSMKTDKTLTQKDLEDIAKAL